MAVYKVAQDVEADDKLIGPFSFRQFIYLIIVALAIAAAWGLSRLFIGLIIIPLPIIVFFGALALPLRKDQPMEVYLGALLSYYLKPHKRTWEPDGITSLIEITAPKVVEVVRTKDITDVEAARRLSYLADIADTQGWAVRHSAQPSNSSMFSDAYFEAQAAEDVLDENGGVSQSLGMMMNQADERRKQAAVAIMHQPTQSAPPTQVVAQPQINTLPIATPFAPFTQMQTSIPPVIQPTTVVQTAAVLPQQPDDSETVEFNPYPSAIRQSVIQPLEVGSQLIMPATPPAEPIQQKNPDETPITTSEKAISPDIINLASNTDLSIETIAREASRIQHKADESTGEVFVSLH